MSEYRYKRVMISANQILNMFQYHNEECLVRCIFKGLPTDIKVVNVYHDQPYMAYSFIIEHPSFDPVNYGDQIPIYENIRFITFQKVEGYVPKEVHLDRRKYQI